MSIADVTKAGEAGRNGKVRPSFSHSQKLPNEVDLRCSRDSPRGETGSFVSSLSSSADHYEDTLHHSSELLCTLRHLKEPCVKCVQNIQKDLCEETIALPSCQKLLYLTRFCPDMQVRIQLASVWLSYIVLPHVDTVLSKL